MWVTVDLGWNLQCAGLMKHLSLSWRVGKQDILRGFLPFFALFSWAGLAADAGGEDLHFAVVADFGKRVYDNGVREMIDGWNPAFVVTLGDNSYTDGSGGKNGFEADVVPSFGKYIENGTFFPCLGNHDFHKDGGGPFQKKRLEFYMAALKPPQGPPGEGRYYEFVKGSARFFVINSNPNGPDSRKFTQAQGDWLREAMRKSKAEGKDVFRVVCFHHPPYSVAKDRGPTVDMQWPFKEWGASLVLSGHDHTYQVFERRGLRYVVNGLGGDSIYKVDTARELPGVTLVKGFPEIGKTGQFGAMRVTVNEQEMKLFMTTVKKVGGAWEKTEFEPVVIPAQQALPPPVYRDLQLQNNPRMKGKDVAAWQDFLFEGKWLATEADGDFGSKTRTATLKFQGERQMAETGILDEATRVAAMKDGFIPVEKPD